MALSYRRDIDGLRGLAVAAVVLYHYGVPGLTGGYVGVDVFFVLSGYLMMSLIHKDLLAGDFSIAQFYERRIRRILPALVAMLLATLACGLAILFPRPLVSLAKTTAAAAVFAANGAFWWRTGYFARAADQMPLLHLWSLSVEGQFYVIFPLLMVFTARRAAGRYALVLWLLAAASFGVSLWSTSRAPGAAFFLLPSRLWELLAGAIAALPSPAVAGHRHRNTALAIAGLALIAAAAFGYSMTTPFPGAAALLPCAGAALVLAAGGSTPTIVNRGLGWPPLVALGRISYSLYLWHWPAYVLTSYELARPLSAAEAASLMALTTGLAAISWKYIEEPFRKPGGVLLRRPFIASGAAAAVTVALALAVVFTAGLPGRFGHETLAILAAEEPATTCDPASIPSADLGLVCTIGSHGSGSPSFVVWGDSHAGAISPAVERAALKYGLSGELSVMNDCPPLPGLVRARWADGSCERRNDAMLPHLRAAGIKTVILAARWAAGLDAVDGYGAGRSHLFWQYDGESRERSLEENRRVFRRALIRTVAILRADGLRVVVVGPVPESSFPVAEMLARRRLRGRPVEPGPTMAAFEMRNRLVLDTFRSSPGAEYVFPHQLLCTGGERCAIVRDGRPLYSDDDHLSRLGAESVSGLFEPVFESIAATGAANRLPLPR